MDLGTGTLVILFAVVGIPILLIIAFVAASRRARGE